MASTAGVRPASSTAAIRRSWSTVSSHRVTLSRTVPRNRRMSWSTDATMLDSRSRPHSRERVAVDADLAGLRLVEAGDELAQGGLAAARFADQRHPLAGRHLEREVLDQRRPERVVAEAHAVQRQTAGGPLDRRARPAPPGSASRAGGAAHRRAGTSRPRPAAPWRPADHLLDRRRRSSSAGPGRPPACRRSGARRRPAGRRRRARRRRSG